MRNAVSELLRFDGPNQFVRRITTQPIAVGDVDAPGRRGALSRASRRPTAILAAGDRRPIRSSSTVPTPTSICSSAAASTPASAPTSPACRPSSSSRAILAPPRRRGTGRRAGVEHPHVHPRAQLAPRALPRAGMSTASDWKARPEGPEYAATRRRLVDAAEAHRARPRRRRPTPRFASARASACIARRCIATSTRRKICSPRSSCRRRCGSGGR